MRLNRQVIILALYVLIAAVLTWPAVQAGRRQVIGQGGDPWQTMWRFEVKEQELKNAFSQGELGAYVREEFLGGGVGRLVNLSVWPWMPVHMLFQQPLAYNIVWLLSFTLSGYFAYLLVKRLLDEHKAQNPKAKLQNAEVAAFVAGLYYMLLPYHVAHAYGHFGAMQMQWLPLLVLLLLRWLARPGVAAAVGLALVFVLQAWTEHHYAFWFGAAALVLLWWYRQELKAVLRERRGLASVAVALTVVAIGLLAYLPTARMMAAPETALELGEKQTVRFSADVSAFFTPAQFHTWWGQAAYRAVSQYFTGNMSESTQFLGFVPLLVIAAVWQRIARRQRWIWMSLAAVFAVISLGPRLHLFGAVTPIPLPFATIQDLPVISVIRTVSRAGVMVGLAAAVLLGWAAFFMRSNRGRVILAVLIGMEFLFWPMPTQTMEQSGVYERVREWPGKSVVEIPVATNYALASRSLYTSLEHGKRVIGNNALERAEGSGAYEEAKSLPALRQLLFLRTAHLRQGRNDFFEQDLKETLPDVMRWEEAGGIVVHGDSLSAGQREAVRVFLENVVGLVPETFADVTAYPAGELGNIVTDGVFLTRDAGWQNVGWDARRGHTYGEVPKEASVLVYNATTEQKQVRLSWTLAPLSQGSLMVENVSGAVGSFEVTVPPRAARKVVFKNTQPGLAIIQDPKLEVVQD